MTAPRLSFFHSSANAVIACVRSRIGARHRRIVDGLEQVADALPAIGTSEFRVDLIGHSQAGLLRFGGVTVDNSDRFVAMFRRLGELGVTEVRLLGCEVGDTGFPATVLKDLNAAIALPRIGGSRRQLRCSDFGHDGLRATQEAGIFGTPPTETADTACVLEQWLDENPRPARRGEVAIEIGIDQLRALQRAVASDHSGCCPSTLGFDGAERIAIAFQVAVTDQVGWGRVVEHADGRLAVIASGLDVEVVYPIADAQREVVTRLIAGW